jgi:hypothetical protein
MRARRWGGMGLLALLAWFSIVEMLVPTATLNTAVGASATVGPTPQVFLQAQAGKNIEFRTQNGHPVAGVPFRGLELPHLVLNRNGRLTDPEERTLLVTVSQLPVLRSGVIVYLSVETQGGDPARAGCDGNGAADRITLWQGSEFAGTPRGSSPSRETVRFVLRFGARVQSGAESVDTPTGYMRYELTVLDAGQSAAAPLHAESREYAFLLENQWVAPLAAGAGGDRAGPQELAIYYADMTPICRNGTGTVLARSEVTPFVSNELVPAMVRAIQVQTQDWGFSWSDAWTSYRKDEDAKRLSVALSDGQTWFHGPAPSDGYADISIRVSGGKAARYDSPTDRVISTFHHELFHNIQRGMFLERFGRQGVPGLSGLGSVWGFFAEGTAVLASSVGQADLQFSQTAGPRDYITFANRFVGGSGFAGELNAYYAEMTPYHSAIYWRYLYEQCGGLDNARAGMGPVRAALEVLYGGDLVDITTSRDVVGQLPTIMDGALTSPAAALCPFHSYRESLVSFARAVYGLRLEGHRCTAPGRPIDCGLYDPNGLYAAPPVTKLSYGGKVVTFDAHWQPYPPGIRSSYGIDLLEVELGSQADGQPLTIEFHRDLASRAEFSVQVWKLMDDGTGSSWQPHLSAAAPAQELKQEDEAGDLVYHIPQIDRTEFNSLALIIVRLDREEELDPVGVYTIVLRPGQQLSTPGCSSVVRWRLCVVRDCQTLYRVWCGWQLG